MNVDKWARCGQFLLINGPGTVIVLYWAPDGVMRLYYYIGLVLDRALRTKETLSDFC